MIGKTMRLGDICSKLAYQKEVNTGYSEGFLGRVEHEPIKTFSSQQSTKYKSGIDGLNFDIQEHKTIGQIIDESKDELFEEISFKFNNEELITDELKKQFIKRFWKKRIGVSTLAEFQNNLDNYFTVECQNLLIQNYILKTLNPNDFIDGGKTNVDNTNQNNSTNSSQGKSDNTSNQDQDQMQGVKSTPDGSTLNITNSKTQLLDRADQATRNLLNNIATANENHSNSGEAESKGTANTVQTLLIGKYNAYREVTLMSNVNEIMVNARKLFLLLG